LGLYGDETKNAVDTAKDLFDTITSDSLFFAILRTNSSRYVCYGYKMNASYGSMLIWGYSSDEITIIRNTNGWTSKVIS
jgi:hypothetical protein